MDIKENIDLLFIEQPGHFGNNPKKKKLIDIIENKIDKIPIIVQFDSRYDDNLTYEVIPKEFHKKIHFLDLSNKDRLKKISEIIEKYKVKNILIGGAHLSDIEFRDNSYSKNIENSYNKLLEENKDKIIFDGCIPRAINDIKSNNVNNIIISNSISIGNSLGNVNLKEEYTKHVPNTISTYYSICSISKK